MRYIALVRGRFAILTLLVVLASAGRAGAEERCEVAAYLEPSAFVAAVAYNHVPTYLFPKRTAGHALARVAGGLHTRGCGAAWLDLPVGITAFRSTIQQAGADGHEIADLPLCLQPSKLPGQLITADANTFVSLGARGLVRTLGP